MIKLIFAMVFSSIVNAEVSNITQQYVGLIKDETAGLIQFKKDFSVSCRKFCPDSPNSDEAHCMYSYFSARPVKSSTDLVLRSVTLVGEYVKKSKAASGPVKLEMTESVLSLLEKIDLGNFYVSKLKANTDAEQLELAELKKVEVEGLNEGIQKLCSTLAAGLKTFESSSSNKREPATIEKLQELKIRIEGVKKRVWRY